jgi:pimeloyl-ACP methyl ester carboxylesterase
MVALWSAGTMIGCQSATPKAPDAVIVVTGVQGRSPEYAALQKELAETLGTDVRVFAWGAPKPLIFLNFSTRSVHEKAERQLAAIIAEHRRQFPDGRLDLIGHSAGCGVILGALARLDGETEVQNVLLLAPSVSPDYEIARALSRVRLRAHVFISDRDTLFLKWRTGNFGTYDRVKTPAAGNVGFNLDKLPDALHAKVQEHRYNEEWRSLGHDGGHFGPLSRRFAQSVLTPLLHDEFVLRP